MKRVSTPAIEFSSIPGASGPESALVRPNRRAVDAIDEDQYSGGNRNL
jgi:hypothetical protein